MAIREQLSKNRKNYWENIISYTNKKLEECLIKYQEVEEYVSEDYNVKLFVKFFEEKDRSLNIYVTINDEQIDFDGDTCLISFKKESSIQCYLDMLCTDLFNGDGSPIGWNSDFSVKDLKDGKEVYIFEVMLGLD